MKKLLFAVSALAALSLLAPSTGFAQAQNILSIYGDEAGTTNSIDMNPFTQADVYLVITNPYNPDAGADIGFLGGVEFGITMTNGLLLGFSWPINVTDVGGSPNNHIAGFGEPLNVVDGMATVCTINVLFNGADAMTPGYIHLAPSVPASVPGAMACLDWGNPGDLIALTPPYENFEYPVLAINDEVATDAMSIDAVKALYR